MKWQALYRASTLALLSAAFSPPQTSSFAQQTALPVIGGLSGPATQPSTHGPSQAELDAADDATDSWLMYNKGYRAERYSRLAQINAENAANLHPVCSFPLGEIGTFSTGPVMYDGLVYVTTHLSTYAIDGPIVGRSGPTSTWPRAAK